MNTQCKKLLQIFWTFFKIAPVTFGGGFAMIPLIEKEVVYKRKWLHTDEVTDVFALSQSIPGAIALNAATFIGFRIGGISGAIVAIIGVSLPTFFIVLLLGILYIFMENNPTINASFQSIRASIVALIIYAAINIGKTALIDKSTVFLFIVGIAALFFIHPIVAILSSAALGVIIISFKNRVASRKNANESDQKQRYKEKIKDSTNIGL
ncbi:chromate transporter [Bacillus sp. JJ722]|uniref:chromate transporter n=1 Tax=Bacillus sp. JJ722 TaxID=3122973 RepID=UPI0030009F26